MRSILDPCNINITHGHSPSITVSTRVKTKRWIYKILFQRETDLECVWRSVYAAVCASVSQDVKFQVMGEHHIRAAVEAVLHSDWSAGETPWTSSIHRPSSEGAAHSVPASRGRHSIRGGGSHNMNSLVTQRDSWMESAPDIKVLSIFPKG